MIVSFFIVLISFFYFFFCIRSIMFGIVDFLMNKNAIKKRKKGMSFNEWLFIKRFRTEIPKYHIVIYYLSFILYLLLFFLLIVFHIKTPYINFGKVRVWIVVGTILFCALYQIVFFGFHTSYTFIHKKEKINIRGINKEKYREKMKKKEADKPQNEN